MTEETDRNSSDEKQISYDHPWVDEDEIDELPVGDYYKGNWENVKNNPESIIGFYKNIRNMPKKHREEAVEKVKNASLDSSSRFLVIGKRQEINVSEDLLRAYSIAVLDSFANRIQQKARWIMSNISQEASLPIGAYPGELGHTIFEMHVSTVSFVEASYIQILHYKIINQQLPDREALIEWGSHESRADIDRAKLDMESEESEIFRWAEDSGVKDLSLALLQSGVIDDSLYRKIDKIRDDRNDLVHRPATLTLKPLTDWESILDRTEDAIDICEEFTEELNDIPRHPAYRRLVEKGCIE